MIGPARIEWLTTQDLCARWGVSRGTIYNWIHKRGLVAHQPPGANGLYRFRIVDVLEFEERMKLTT